MDLNEPILPTSHDEPIRTRSDSRGWAVAIIILGFVGFGAITGGIIGYAIGRAFG